MIEVYEVRELAKQLMPLGAPTMYASPFPYDSVSRGR